MNYLLINLAVADIIYAAFTIPYMVLTHSSIQPNGATGKLFYTFGTFAWAGAASSVFTLVTVAVERYWRMVHPYDGRRKRLTMRKLRVCSKSNTLINVNLRQSSRHLHRYIEISQFTFNYGKIAERSFSADVFTGKSIVQAYKVRNPN